MERVEKFPGVYYRESESRKHQGKADRCFYITYKDAEGDKKVWEKVGWQSEGYSAQMGSHLRAERMRSIRHGEELPKKKMKEVRFGEVWEEYSKWLETGKKRPRDDRYYYAKHLRDRFADKPLSKICPFDLEKLKTDLLNDGLAPATVKHNLVLVRQIYNKAISWEMWSGENPINKVKLPKLNNKRVNFFTYDQAKTLLEKLSMTSSQLHDISLLSLHTGMRAGEVFGLKWEHIDFETKIVRILDSKSGRSRNVFMNAMAFSMLQHRGPAVSGEFVFKSKTGGQIQAISKAFRAVIDHLGFNAGIKDPRDKLTFHSLRHTFASWLAIAGTPILTIKELLGHQTLAMTERYAHLIPDVKREAVREIERRFLDISY